MITDLQRTTEEPRRWRNEDRVERDAALAREDSWFQNPSHQGRLHT
jgi:hypothetical protein